MSKLTEDEFQNFPLINLILSCYYREKDEI